MKNDPRQQLADYSACNPEQAQIYNCVMALRELIAKGESQLLFRLGVISGAQDARHAKGALIRYSVDNVFNHETGEVGPQILAGLKVALETAENSQEFKMAAAVIEPLESEIIKIETAEARCLAERAKAESALRLAEETAKEEALASVKTNPVVLAARKTVAALIREGLT